MFVYLLVCKFGFLIGRRLSYLIGIRHPYLILTSIFDTDIQIWYWHPYMILTSIFGSVWLGVRYNTISIHAFSRTQKNVLTCLPDNTLMKSVMIKKWYCTKTLYHGFLEQRWKGMFIKICQLNRFLLGDVAHDLVATAIKGTPSSVYLKWKPPQKVDRGKRLLFRHSCTVTVKYLNILI
jgi:hypothetical protein